MLHFCLYFIPNSVISGKNEYINGRKCVNESYGSEYDIRSYRGLEHQAGEQGNHFQT